MKAFIRKFNGWLGFALASIAFFVVPHFYRLFDPTAGQFDAGYIHPIIYGAVVICFCSGLSWTLILITAPSIHKNLDRYFEDTKAEVDESAVVLGMFLYLVYFLSSIAFIAFVV